MKDEIELGNLEHLIVEKIGPKNYARFTDLFVSSMLPREFDEREAERLLLEAGRIAEERMKRRFLD